VKAADAARRGSTQLQVWPWQASPPDGSTTRTDQARPLRYSVRRGCSLVGKHWVSNPATRVRFPPPALADPAGTLFSEVKTRERDRARQLRSERGYSIKQIAALLNVSTSSVSLWVRDIELTADQHEALRQRSALYDGQLVGRAVASSRRRAERRAYQEHGRALARRGDVRHAMGCMLYWAEGTKNRNQIRFSNSDPEMVRTFVSFLRTYFPLGDEDIRLTCHLFADHVDRQREIENFWLKVAQLPRSSLCQSIVNVYSKYSLKKRRNKLPFGTCRVVVSRTSVAQSIYGAIQEYAGFDRPAWLDA
jgi:Homeodomain-like domain